MRLEKEIDKIMEKHFGLLVNKMPRRLCASEIAERLELDLEMIDANIFKIMVGNLSYGNMSDYMVKEICEKALAQQKPIKIRVENEKYN